jgi:hypothetical protein
MIPNLGKLGDFLASHIHNETEPFLIGTVLSETCGFHSDAIGQSGMDLVGNLLGFELPAKGLQVGFEDVDPKRWNGRLVIPLQ